MHNVQNGGAAVAAAFLTRMAPERRIVTESLYQVLFCLNAERKLFA
jgi:hypothetical protein